ncbi:ABC transporter ATP-binding protein [Nitrosomonas sp. Is35]|uniref:ABC transporter ATP-binding protein n=1 Tax=Nitrosomonas sp. Is35 TaxID=3080534 RepID=UPI00294B3107|nr:ABC transporter ATP-binding protein [Nitrosomonas sp. Is35]MDV6346015.1 ABC transporter ATP-binding protein [Nitrosomonas sp. Is35]
MKIPPILHGYRRILFIRLVSNGLLQAALAIGTAWLVKEIFDGFLTVQQPVLDTRAVWLVAGLIMAAACIGWLRMAERIDAEKMGQHYAAEVRILLYDCLSFLTPRTLQKRSRGGVSLRFVGDMTSLRRWISMGLARVTVAGVSTVSALLLLGMINWQLTVTVTVSLAMGAWLTYLFGKRMRAAAKESRRRLSNLAANVNEKVTSIAVVQVFGQVDREREHIIRQGKYLQDSMVARARIAGQILGITEFSAAMTSATTLLAGIFAVTTGTASVGAVIAAITIVGILLPPLRDLGRIQEYWHGAGIARERIKEFLDSPSLVAQTTNAPDLTVRSGGLKFDSVSVTGGLNKLSGTIAPGKVVAVVGPNGAGKSTLLLLAARLIDPHEGKVFLDGQNLAEHSLNSVRQAVGMAGPDLPLLRGTIERNLRYRWRNAPDKEVARVRVLCGIDEMLVPFPEGDKTRVAEGGLNLSVGQRQRIALARALLGNPPLLLLDEADANLDSQASKVIDRILASYQGTVLMVTHHVDHIMAADEIWYLEAGRLLEAGPPAALLSGDGPVARFFGISKPVAI